MSALPLASYVTVMLSQWLCEQGHCSIGLCWDTADEEAPHVEAMVEALFTAGRVNRRCGICGFSLHVEHSATVFATVAEAKPALQLLEREQIRDRRRMYALGLAIEPMPSGINEAEDLLR